MANKVKSQGYSFITRGNRIVPFYYQTKEEIAYESDLDEDIESIIQDYFDLREEGSKSATECLELLIEDLLKVRNK